MRSTDHYHGVSESLQADVMRFMAIIAFCLIAILALVRGVEPTSLPASEAPEPGAPEPGAPEPAAPEARPIPPAPAAPEYAVAAPARAISLPRPVERAVEAPRPRIPELPAEPPPVRQKAQPAPSATPDPAPPPSAPPAPADEGLSLRFASERDFLRLMNTGGVRVFAYRDGEVLSVSADFRFEAVAAPGRLHELLPDTIPRLMTNALKTARGGADYHWGIAMPAAMSRQIRDYVERGVSGELVIDGRGEVHHEA